MVLDPGGFEPPGMAFTKRSYRHPPKDKYFDVLEASTCLVGTFLQSTREGCCSRDKR